MSAPVIFVFKIPFHCFPDSAFKCFLRFPVKFMTDFSGVNGITQIVSGTVFNKDDLIFIFFTVRARCKFIQQRADRFNNFNILFFVVTADVVGFSGNALRGNKIQCSCVVFHIEPVTNLLSFSVNRKFLAVKGVQNNQRNEFFRKVIRTVVVGAVCYQSRQSESSAPCPDQMIA